MPALPIFLASLYKFTVGITGGGDVAIPTKVTTSNTFASADGAVELRDFLFFFLAFGANVWPLALFFLFALLLAIVLLAIFAHTD